MLLLEIGAWITESGRCRNEMIRSRLQLSNFLDRSEIEAKLYRRYSILEE